MNKSDLIKKYATDFGVTQEQATTSVNAVVDYIAGSVSRGEDVSLAGFGNFSVKATNARTGRNPATGAEVQIPAGKKLSFKPAKALKDSL